MIQQIVPVTFKFFVPLRHIIHCINLAHQEVFLSAKEWNRFQTLDAIFLLPSAKVFCVVEVQSGCKGQQ